MVTSWHFLTRLPARQRTPGKPHTGESLTASSSSTRYTLLSSRGRVGMGEVFLADDTQLGRKVAIRFLSEALEANEKARERLRRSRQKRGRPSPAGGQAVVCCSSPIRVMGTSARLGPTNGRCCRRSRRT